MKLSKIEMGMYYPHGYDAGCEPGIRCELEFQIPGTYSRFTVKLSDEQTHSLAAQAAAFALDNIKFDSDSICVAGKPGTPPPEPKSDLPDGLREKDGKIEFQCRVCEHWTEWAGEASDYDPDAHENVCGGSPSCCP